MNIKSIIAAAAAIILTASSCGVIGGSSVASGSTSGQAAGAALKGLYSQYKADGKLDFRNVNNIINMASLANGIQGLKNNDDKSAFYTNFASGLILGSNNLVNTSNSSNILSGLSKLASTDLSAFQNATSPLLNVPSDALVNLASKTIISSNPGVDKSVNTLSNIFNLFK